MFGQIAKFLFCLITHRWYYWCNFSANFTSSRCFKIKFLIVTEFIFILFRINCPAMWTVWCSRHESCFVFTSSKSFENVKQWKKSRETKISRLAKCPIFTNEWENSFPFWCYRKVQESNCWSLNSIIRIKLFIGRNRVHFRFLNQSFQFSVSLYIKKVNFSENFFKNFPKKPNTHAFNGVFDLFHQRMMRNN